MPSAEVSFGASKVMSVAMTIRLKRVYEEPTAADGERTLVDRLWPRGLTKERARVDVWVKDVAPSTELRKWFGHDPSRWAEFQRRYRAELKGNPHGVAELRDAMKKGTVTLVFGAKDEQHNEAVVLLEWLKEHPSR
jgi:uncharacterized protein YeaO (DUF488 family)